MAKHTHPTGPKTRPKGAGGRPPNTPDGVIGKRLAALMAERQINQSELSRLTDIPQARISNLIRGKVANPLPHRLAAMCRALGVSLTEFFDPLTTEERDAYCAGAVAVAAVPMNGVSPGELRDVADAFAEISPRYAATMRDLIRE